MFNFRAWFLVTVMSIAGTLSADASAFNAAQSEEIGKIASEYLVAHPEVLMEALKKLEQVQLEAQVENVKKAGEHYRSDAQTPSVGSSQAPHYIVEFFDYYCGYCKYMEPMMQRLSKEHGQQVQVIYVNLPVISKASAKAASVGQAIFDLDQERYFDFHRIMMSEEIDGNDLDNLKAVTQRIGLDWDKVVSEMKSKTPQEKLTSDLQLSHELGISGTPYFIIDGKEYRGAVQNYDSLLALVGADQKK